MAYTSTQAQSGNGSILAINTGTVSSAIWTTVGEISDIAQSGKTNKSDDATNLQSSAEEFIPTILTPGSWGLTLNRVSGDAGIRSRCRRRPARSPLGMLSRSPLWSRSSTTSGR
jgi:hypothetical protein